MGRGVDRRKLAAWRRRLARQEASGLTVAAFCRQERVSVSLWKYWQRQVERNATVVSVSPPVRPALASRRRPGVVVLCGLTVGHARDPAGEVKPHLVIVQDHEQP